MARKGSSGQTAKGWDVEKLGFTELEGWIQDVCFCRALSVHPPLRRRGRYNVARRRVHDQAMFPVEESVEIVSVGFP